MKIAIDISPLESGHKVRGTGFYLHYLKLSLEKYFPGNTYTFFTEKQKIPDNVGLVHYPYFEPFFLTLPFTKKNKVVVTVHDLTPIKFSTYFPRGIKGNIKWQIQKYLLKKVDAILTDSESSKKDILRLLTFPEKKVHVAYLAAGEEFKRIKNLPGDRQGQEVRIKELRKKYALPDKFALYVGDVTWNKNLPRLIQAVQTVKIPLVMVGKALVNDDFDRSHPWNSDLVEVQKMAKKDKNIFRLGFVSTDELVLLYNIATVFVMPSLYEGFGLPILEAMSCGCPVVTTKEGSLPEIAEEAAYYIDGYSTESLAKGIKAVFENSILQRELSDKGIVQAKKFTWEKTAAQTMDVYKQIV